MAAGGRVLRRQGARHRHLIYARFITKALHDLGLVDFTEPFVRVTNPGQVILRGKAMSKTLGNLVDLADEIARYGPDAVRVMMIFAGPPEEDIDWADVAPAGAVRWLSRVLRLAADVGGGGAGTGGAGADVGRGGAGTGGAGAGIGRGDAGIDGGAVRADVAGAGAGRTLREGDLTLRRGVHRLIDETTDLMERKRLNVAVARLMQLTSLLRRAVDTGAGPADPAVREGAAALARMLSCFAPFTAEEAWERLGYPPSVVEGSWPEVDRRLVAQDTVTCVVQVAGKVRDRLEVPVTISEAELRKLAVDSGRARAALGGAPIRQVIVRPPRLVNIVPASSQ